MKTPIMVKYQAILIYLKLVTSAVVLATLSSCSSIHKGQNSNKENREVKNQNGFLLHASQDEFEQIVQNVDVKSRIMEQYGDWKGVRYRLGGDNKRGIDCSAFVQRTFREQFGLNLPRSTSKQQDTGMGISRNKLKPGDLVLFRAGSAGRHVGIYLGNDHFVHASTSSGVMISSLNDSYWKSRYREARRVLAKNSSISRF